MHFSLSTSYFAGHHLSPEAIAERVCALGFNGVELGYFTRENEIAPWAHLIERYPLDIKSLHAFCPMPIGMPQLGPEVYSLADPDPTAREQAIAAILRALNAAQTLGAEVIVCHGGRVDLRQNGLLFGTKAYRSQLSHAFRARGGAPDFALAQKEKEMRANAAPRWVDNLSRALDRILPHFESAQTVLAFENLPGLEAFPDPAELAFLKHRFPTPALGAWYDIGHGERKARVGDWSIQDTLAFTAGFTAGVHIHDVVGLEEDHSAPGEGGVDFEFLRPLLEQEPLLRVFEPNPNLSEARLQAGLAFMQAFFQNGTPKK